MRYSTVNTLTAKKIWITGASSGLGEALAYALAKQGADLILSSRSVQELDRVRLGCQDPSRVVVHPFDVSEINELEAITDRVWASYGPIDILINNSGRSQRSRASETPASSYEQLFRVNFQGPAEISRIILRYFLARNSGTFVVISSVAGVTGLPARTGYCASKFALEGFFASLRTEVWQTNVRVLVVRPGAIRTRISQNALGPGGRKHEQPDPVIENGLAPDQAASKIVAAVMAGKTKLEIGSFRERLLFLLNRIAPDFIFNKTKRLNN